MRNFFDGPKIMYLLTPKITGVTSTKEEKKKPKNENVGAFFDFYFHVSFSFFFCLMLWKEIKIWHSSTTQMYELNNVFLCSSSSLRLLKVIKSIRRTLYRKLIEEWLVKLAEIHRIFTKQWIKNWMMDNPFWRFYELKKKKNSKQMVWTW